MELEVNNNLFNNSVKHLDWCKCPRCNEKNCFGGCLPFGYGKKPTCPECQNNPSYITQDNSWNACSCRTCGGYEEVMRIHDEVVITPTVKVPVCNYPLCMFGGMGCEQEGKCEEKSKSPERKLAEQQFEIWWKLNLGFLSVEPFRIEEGIARSAWLASRGIK